MDFSREASSMHQATPSLGLLPADFWPSFDVWYLGGACYVCNLATQILRLRQEHCRAVGEQVPGRGSQKKCPQGTRFHDKDIEQSWVIAICEDVASLLVDASADIGGSFLHHLSRVIKGEYPKWRPRGPLRDTLLAWIVGFLHDPDFRSKIHANTSFVHDWLDQYYRSIRLSAQSLCHRLWGRHISSVTKVRPLARSFGIESNCPCSDTAFVVYQQIESNRVRLARHVFPGLKQQVLCEHLVPVLGAWHSFQPLLPASSSMEASILNASCAIAVAFARRSTGWKGVMITDDRSMKWFNLSIGLGTLDDREKCIELAGSTHKKLRDMIRQARGTAPDLSFGEHHQLCTDLGRLPIDESPSFGTYTVASWFFELENLVEQRVRQDKCTLAGLSEYRVAVPLQSAIGFEPLETSGVCSKIYYGPWRLTEAAAARDRETLFKLQVLAGYNTSILQDLLCVIDEALIFRNRSGSEQLVDSAGLLARQSAPQANMLEEIRLVASADVIAEIVSHGKSVQEICSLVEAGAEPELFWFSPELLIRWCHKSGRLHRRDAQCTRGQQVPVCVKSDVTQASVLSTPEVPNTLPGFFGGDWLSFREVVAWILVACGWVLAGKNWLLLRGQKSRSTQTQQTRQEVHGGAVNHHSLAGHVLRTSRYNAQLPLQPALNVGPAPAA